MSTIAQRMQRLVAYIRGDVPHSYKWRTVFKDSDRRDDEERGSLNGDTEGLRQQQHDVRTPGEVGRRMYEKTHMGQQHLKYSENSLRVFFWRRQRRPNAGGQRRIGNGHFSIAKSN